MQTTRVEMEGIDNGVGLDSTSKETNNVGSFDELNSSNKYKANWIKALRNTKVKKEIIERKIKRQESTEKKTTKRQEKTESKNEEKTPEEECLIQIQESQQTSWVPDGGWGWMVVVGGIIIHVFIGTRQ